jgi:hypothetical protein
MSGDRIFTDEELQNMGKRTLDLLLEKLDSGDVEVAGKLAQQMYNEFLGMHDLYRDWITHLFTFIGKHYGDDTLREQTAPNSNAAGRSQGASTAI